MGSHIGCGGVSTMKTSMRDHPPAPPAHQLPTTQSFGPFAIDRGAREVTRDGQAIPLTRSEYELLSLLAAHPHTALSSRFLLQSLWEAEWFVSAAPLHVHISRLRRKLGENGAAPRHVIAVRGYGYRFEPNPAISFTTHRLPSSDRAHPAHALVAVDRTLRWLSDDIAALIGWTPEEAEGRAILDLVHPEDWDTGIDSRSTLNAGHPVVINWRFLTPWGNARPIESHARPIFGPTGTFDGILGEWHHAPGSARSWRPGWEPSAAMRPIRLDASRPPN